MEELATSRRRTKRLRSPQRPAKAKTPAKIPGYARLKFSQSYVAADTGTTTPVPCNAPVLERNLEKVAETQEMNLGIGRVGVQSTVGRA